MRGFSLIPFQEPSIRELKVSAGIGRRARKLEFEFTVQPYVKDIFWHDRLSTPMLGSELYKSTCFEIFLAVGDCYVEYNFSPSREWCAYGFSSYRQPAAFNIQDFAPVRLDSELAGSRAVVSGELDLKNILSQFALTKDDAPFAVGVSAVLKIRGESTYWALTHKAKVPDFHVRESFTLSI